MMERRDSDPAVMLGLVVVVTLITALAVTAIVVILALT